MADSPLSPEMDALIPRVEAVEHRIRRRSTVLLMLVSVVFILQVSMATLGFWQLMATKKDQENLEFSQAVDEYTHGTDFIAIQVGTIQFLRHGYSIILDSARYTQDGLALSGSIGNPTHLWISSLTLNFSVRPYAYQVRQKWNKDKFVFWNPSEFETGKAQVNVGLLNAGSTAEFSVTIPNVRQTSDEPQVAVWFSGERYSYLK